MVRAGIGLGGASPGPGDTVRGGGGRVCVRAGAAPAFLLCGGVSACRWCSATKGQFRSWERCRWRFCGWPRPLWGGALSLFRGTLFSAMQMSKSLGLALWRRVFTSSLTLPLKGREKFRAASCRTGGVLTLPPKGREKVVPPSWVRQWSLLVALTLSLCVWALWPLRASAQEPPLPIRVSTNAPLPLLVDEVETTSPALLSPGRQVCVSATLHYISDVDRWVFQGWSHGPKDPCVILTRAGTYRAVYTHEFVWLFRPGAPGLQRNMWVQQGVPVDLEVPLTVQEGERTRYRFQEWNGGGTPFLPANRFAVQEPRTVDVKWTKEYLVSVEGPEGVALSGAGWYAEGSSLFLQAPELVPGPTPKERFKFLRWESASPPILQVPNAENATTSTPVGAPYSLRAVYEKQFLFVVRNPSGLLKQAWVKEDEEVEAGTPPVLEIVPEQVQLVFQRWEGIEGVALPQLTGRITAPTELMAIYERQVMVTVVGAHGGSGGGWQAVGSIVTVSVPESVENKVIFVSRFKGFPGYVGTKPTMQQLVQAPVTVTALYGTQINLPVLLAIFALAPAAVVIVYIFTVQIRRMVDRRKKAPEV